MHNISFISNVTNKEKVFKNISWLKNENVKFFTLNSSNEEIISLASETEIIVVDAMGKVDRELINSLPKLRFIQSEGVGYQGVDIKAASEKGIIVSNNKGVNDTAVAETALLLILACLKSLTKGSIAVYNGKQIEAKKASFGVVKELSECTVGLVGFGDIARQTARLLSAFGARVIYSNRTRYEALESEYNVEYKSLEELLRESDFVSLHLAVCDETRGIVNASFLSKMKQSAFLINTSRGELVDNGALYSFLINNKISGAGLDVISPEPVEKNNLLLDEKIKEKLVLTPHIAGITSLTVKKIFDNIGSNILKVINDQKPINIVN